MNSAIIDPSDYTRTLNLAELFPTSAPLEIDVGCGKGRFLAARAKRLPEFNFLGIDRLLARLRRVDKKIWRDALSNVRLLRLEAAYTIAYLLPAASVSMFHVFFPDPWPKRRHHRRRLFTETFPSDLHRVLRPGGQINVATDHADYFAHIHSLLASDTRYTEIEPFAPCPEERTDFEVLFLNKGDPVSRCSFKKRT